MTQDRTDPALWARLEAWCASTDAETLKDRAFRELRMERRSVEAVIPEYARYAYLVCLRDDYVTPPPLLARIAKLHIEQDGYAEAFSRDTLGRSLPGFSTEKVPLSDPGHTQARALYEDVFEEPAPTDIWHASGAKWHRILHLMTTALMVASVIGLAIGYDRLSDGQLIAAVIGVGVLFVAFMGFFFTGPKRVAERPTRGYGSIYGD